MATIKVCACGNTYESHDWRCHRCAMKEMVGDKKPNPTFASLHQAIEQATQRIRQEAHLAGLSEAIMKVHAFRLAAENYCPETVVTSTMFYQLAKLIDDLETGAALLKKSIENGG